MIGRLDLYFLKRVAGTFAIVFLAVAGLAATLDVLANAEKAVEATGGVDGIGLYALARLPLIALKMAPIAGLLSALVTLLGLARSGELAAAAALGASQGRTARALLPAAFLMTAALVLIGEFAAPPAAAVLRGMGLNPFAEIARPTDAVWLRDGDDVVRIGRISADERQLDDVTIFQRDPEGRLIAEVRAMTATRQDGGWRLEKVVRLQSDASPAVPMEALDWPSPLGSQSFRTLAAHPQELPLADIRALAGLPGASPKPSFYYVHWINLRFAEPVAAGLLLLLAVPFAGRMTRGRSLATPMALGLLVGFAFFVFENLATAAAESGAISAFAGAWGPPALLAAAIVALAAFQERPG